MKSRPARSAAAVIIAAFALTVGSPAVPGEAAGAAAALRPDTGKLTPRLAALASPALRAASRRSQASALSLPARGAGSLLRRGDRILVDVRFDSAAGSHVGALRAAGARSVFVTPRYQTVTVAVAPGLLHAVAQVPGVRAVLEDLAPIVAGSGPGPQTVTSSTCPAGTKVSEGDTQLKAATARSNFSVDGSGVTVGVLSDSFDRNASAATHASDDVSSGDLPGSTNTCGAGFTTPVNVVDDTGSGHDEGRAMLQIVHDLAPEASLAFATADGGQLAFANNIKALKTAGAKVIVDDVTYPDEPFFQDGPVSVAVNDVTAGGADYYSSAGNGNLIVGGHNAASFEAPAFRNSQGCPSLLSSHGLKQCMDFKPGSGVDRTYGLRVGNGATVKIDLQWAQPWFGVKTDLDAYILNSAGTRLLGYSENSNVTNTKKPFEFVSWTNTTGSAKNVNLVVNRFTGSNGGNRGTPRIKFNLVENGDTRVHPTEYTTSGGGNIVGPEIFGHNGAAKAMSVAAVRYNHSATVEPYSSRGPVTLYFGPVNGTSPASAIQRKTVNKPDIAATDCGVTTFFASFNGTNWRFCGTSAAAPHAAAVAALEQQLSPSATFTAIRKSQTSTAAPVGSFGHTAAGAGLLDANAAGTALTSP